MMKTTLKMKRFFKFELKLKKTVVFKKSPHNKI